ncbi:UDP N acetylglucosamine dolichyl phosphate [Trichuris trichiura]|uniref:UDP-N-acetylglucosamine--dolichyl-phosphate N-acetylglucosaminephosphotransferase n=1 Tax=Trichuris trichiura TaxID=36087 RepID=A0A077ZJG4_TRITR|nr:UDP N acetylglucosamine dolichyl phosphate [Trichuris trichiura]
MESVPVVPLMYNMLLSAGGALLANSLVKEFSKLFAKLRMQGTDMCKKSRSMIPQPMGVVTAAIYMIILFLFIPAPFYRWIYDSEPMFPYHRFVEFLSGVLSICSMIFLGFADDILNLKWRHKLLLPSIATLPLLMVYAVNSNSTSVAVPIQLQPIFGAVFNLGILYYAYIGMLAVFCTNAINIYAGINGLEVGQSLVIALSIIAFNIIQILRLESQLSFHLFSLYFTVPYVFTSTVLLRWNWYPARVFVGDTFCYFSGMLFAVVGILGHFSKTLLLFFMPQVLNFLLSLPQLFHVIPCPRHRLPKYDESTDRLTYSVAQFRANELTQFGSKTLSFFEKFGLVAVRKKIEGHETVLECSNFTLINLALKLFGPMHEKCLALLLISLQVVSSLFAFFLRFYLAKFFFNVVE